MTFVNIAKCMMSAALAGGTLTPRAPLPRLLAAREWLAEPAVLVSFQHGPLASGGRGAARAGLGAAALGAVRRAQPQRPGASLCPRIADIFISRNRFSHFDARTLRSLAAVQDILELSTLT